MSRMTLASYTVPPNASIEPDWQLALAIRQFNANADVLQHPDGSQTVTWWVEGGERALRGEGRVTYASAPPAPDVYWVAVVSLHRRWFVGPFDAEQAHECASRLNSGAELPRRAVVIGVPIES